MDCPAAVRACVSSKLVKSNQQIVDAKSPLFADESAYPHPLGAAAAGSAVIVETATVASPVVASNSETTATMRPTRLRPFISRRRHEPRTSPIAAACLSCLSNSTSTRPPRSAGTYEHTPRHASIPRTPPAAAEFSTAAGTFEIGYRLEPAAEGRGLITAACRMLLTYTFAERGLHRAEWRCRADNVRSSAVAERLGMTLEGVLREAWKVGDTFYDKQVWSVLAQGARQLTSTAWVRRRRSTRTTLKAIVATISAAPVRAA
jgi:hypothetical protein